MNDALLTGALPIYAKLLAESCDVEVQFGAQQASTNGRVIYLPTLPADSKIAQALAYGIVMHEEGHISETTFADASSQKILQGMINLLEDVRMEKVQQRKYPGGKRRLNAMVDALVATGYFSPVPDHCTANEAMSAFILTRLRADILGQSACEPLAVSAQLKCEALLPAAALAKLQVLMYQVSNCQSTADVAVLAGEIVKMLEEEANKPPPDATDNDSANGDDPDAGDEPADGDDPDAGDEPADGDDPDAGDEPVDGDDSDAGDDPADGDDPDAGDDPADGDDPDAGDEPADGDDPDAGDEPADGDDPDAGDEPVDGDDPDAGDDPADGDDPDAGDEPADGDDPDAGDEPADGVDPQAGDGHGDADKLENLRKILAGDDDVGMTDLGDLAKEAINAQVVPYGSTSILLPMHEVAPDQREKSAEALETVAQTSRALKRRLYNLLEAEAESTVHYGRHGRLSSKRIVRLAVGDPRVFERTQVGTTLDTAILVLVDRSGSMCGSIDIATQVTLSLTASLDGLSGVEVCAAAFPHYMQGGQCKEVLMLKDFSESIRTVAGRFVNVGVTGCTPLAEALMWSGWQLMSRPETRKILFVVTDGEPDSLISTRYMLDQLSGAGVELMGLGIGINVGGLFPTSRAIGSVAELNKAVFDMMSKQLLQAA